MTEMLLYENPLPTTNTSDMAYFTDIPNYYTSLDEFFLPLDKVEYSPPQANLDANLIQSMNMPASCSWSDTSNISGIKSPAWPASISFIDPSAATTTQSVSGPRYSSNSDDSSFSCQRSLDNSNAVPAPTRRKRGRPRLSSRDALTRNNSYSQPNARQAERVPHHQVERKYREALNARFEQLRCAVPTLFKIQIGSERGDTRPGKSMVLAAAVEYIKELEHQRDTAHAEMNRLRSMYAGRFSVQ